MNVTYRKSPFALVSMNPLAILMPKYYKRVFTYAIEYRTNYIVLTDTSVILRTGLMDVKTQEIPYEQITAVSVEQSFPGRIFNFGNVLITTGNDLAVEIIHGIQSPLELRNNIYDQASKLRPHGISKDIKI